ncbi:MAG: GNAT family N-acetyltransferase [Ardenticatenaceae bacterium]|nr:GNAT family N-acetyltransferase [Ardenticatenaceae bacterium]
MTQTTFYALDNDPEVMQFLNGGIPTPRDVIQNEILPNFLHDDAQYPGYGFWAVAAKESGMFLGWLSLRATGAYPGEASLGFRLRKSAWVMGMRPKWRKPFFIKVSRSWAYSVSSQQHMRKMYRLAVSWKNWDETGAKVSLHNRRFDAH